MDNKKIINKYDYTNEVIKETMSKWWWNKFRRGIIEMVLGAVLMSAFYFWSQNLFFLIVAAGCVLVFVMLLVNRQKAAKIEQERLAVVTKTGQCKVTVELDDEITITNSSGTKSIDYNSVEKVIESENYLILCVKGQMIITLKKDSFTIGNEAECKGLMREKGIKC